jgi:hypothetical protein
MALVCGESAIERLTQEQLGEVGFLFEVPSAAR